MSDFMLKKLLLKLRRECQDFCAEAAVASGLFLASFSFGILVLEQAACTPHPRAHPSPDLAKEVLEELAYVLQRGMRIHHGRHGRRGPLFKKVAINDADENVTTRNSPHFAPSTMQQVCHVLDLPSPSHA